MADQEFTKTEGIRRNCYEQYVAYCNPTWPKKPPTGLAKIGWLFDKWVEACSGAAFVQSQLQAGSERCEDCGRMWHINHMDGCKFVTMLERK